ncbi:M23 family metallopeptidase [Paenibacillus wynnii]|nr:M23 family metallopeptidase [Paenibacillus wynnii]
MLNNKRRNLTHMGRTLISLLMIVLVMASCSGNNQGNPKGDTSDMKRIGGEDIAPMILAGEYERLYVQFSEDLKKMVKLEEFRSLGEEFTKDIDSFQLLSNMQVNGAESLVWNDISESKELTATVDAKGTIIGIQILPHEPHPETDDAYSKTLFNLPFGGEWLVYWGGKSRFVNYHYEYEQIRYAYDFLKEKNGYTYEGNPKLNDSYFAFNEEIYAPAEGVVVEAIDGILDNEPVGKMNEEQPAGNMVLIQHTNGEYSTIAHLKKGSVKVKTGDTVTTGQLIGLCGNSGNSSEPHIHFQVSSGTDENKLTTLPITFKDGLEPIRGDIVSGTINKQ